MRQIWYDTKRITMADAQTIVNGGYVPGENDAWGWVRMTGSLSDNPLTAQLLDLITLMPDQQVQEIVDYIATLRATRAGPVALTGAQELNVKAWAADDRLWTTQETVETNLRTFARLIVKLAYQ